MAMLDSDATEYAPDGNTVRSQERRGVRSSRLKHLLWTGLGWTLAGFGAVLVGSALWVRRTFGHISVDQMLMNLGGGGADAPQGYAWSFVNQAVLVPLTMLALTWVLANGLFRFVSYRWRQSCRSYSSPRRATSTAWKRLGATGRLRTRPVLSVLALCIGAVVFGQTVGVLQFVRSMTTPLTMEEYYVAPEVGTTVSPAAAQDRQLKNLVIIYLESGEDAFGDDEVFEFDMNAPLEEATKDWSRFEPLEMYVGGGWTMAGIVGTECGVPLRGPGIGVDDINSNEIGARTTDYMPNAVCLGDVLSGAGYTNVFMGGADASFASKRDFLVTHGYDEVHDLGTWNEDGEAELSSWGLSDRALMDRAKEEVTRLHEADDPFHLSLLTLDAHEPVHVYDYCPVESKTEMTSVIRCSMEQVAGFVDYLDEQGYLEDTAVMITGDHPKMLGEGASFYEELAPLTEHPLFNRLWDPDGAEIRRTSIDQLSLYATLLDVLGLGRTDGRAGVGVSALRPASSDAGLLSLSQEEYTTMIQSRSAAMYRSLWGADASETLEVTGNDCGQRVGAGEC